MLLKIRHKLSINCPLCGETDGKVIDKIKVSELKTIYKHILNYDLSPYFEGVSEITLVLCNKCDLRYFVPPIEGTDDFYEALQKFPWYYLDEKREYDLAKDFISPSACVMEIGCGKGNFAKQISTNRYIGLEISGKAVREAQSVGLNVFQQHIQDYLKQHTEKYDIVCAFQVLEHVSGINDFISSAIQCLKPNGLLILSVPSENSFVSLQTNAVLNMPPHHLSRWSDKSLQFIANLFPLEVVMIQHEMLSDIHINSYCSTIIYQAINRFTKHKYRLVDTTLSTRLIIKAAYIMGKIYSPVVRRISDTIVGHSVTAIYRKH